MCQQEDRWDALMNEQLEKPGDTVKWIDAIQQAERENQEAYEKSLRKDRELTKKMQKIVDVETKLALMEGQTIARGRKRHPIRVIKPGS